MEGDILRWRSKQLWNLWQHDGKGFKLRFELCGVGGGKVLGFQITEDSGVLMGKYPCSSDF